MRSMPQNIRDIIKNKIENCETTDDLEMVKRRHIYILAHDNELNNKFKEKESRIRYLCQRLIFFV